MQDYTRNIIAPYLMKFDHIPLPNNQSDNIKKFIKENYSEAPNPIPQIDVNQFDIKPKSLDEYRNNLFIINALRYKHLNIDGQIVAYNRLLEQSKLLLERISEEKLKISVGK